MQDLGLGDQGLGHKVWELKDMAGTQVKNNLETGVVEGFALGR